MRVRVCVCVIFFPSKLNLEFQAGGPFYPLQTGRRDSTMSFPEVATYDLPTPFDDLPKTVAAFALRGFNEQETVTLLGTNISFLTFFLFLHSFLPEKRLLVFGLLSASLSCAVLVILSIGLNPHSPQVNASATLSVIYAGLRWAIFLFQLV